MICDILGDRRLCCIVFLHYCYTYPPQHNSFPTRRSSDLAALPLRRARRSMRSRRAGKEQETRGRSFIPQLFERRRADQRNAEAAIARANRLQEVTARLAGALTPQQVLDAIVTQGVEAAEARAGAIGLLSPDGETVDVVAARGYEESTLAGWESFPLAADTPM